MKLVLFLFLVCSSMALKAVDYIIFSFDRPLQLYALLESSERYFTGLHKTHVIYRASSSSYAYAYKEIAARFPWAVFHKQGSNPKKDFKRITLSCMYTPMSSCPYVLFAVDDMIVTSRVNLSKCVEAMEKNSAWGFFLRLGKNITHCYMLNIATPPPKGKVIKDEFFRWRFIKGLGDWNYPCTTDQTIYRKRDIAPFFFETYFTNPNSLESQWAKEWRMHADKSRFGICFTSSKNINLPLNLVNPSTNRCQWHYSADDLLKKFLQGMKIDIDQFAKMRNKSPHVDDKPTFIPRMSAL